MMKILRNVIKKRRAHFKVNLTTKNVKVARDLTRWVVSLVIYMASLKVGLSNASHGTLRKVCMMSFL